MSHAIKESPMGEADLYSLFFVVVICTVLGIIISVWTK